MNISPDGWYYLDAAKGHRVPAPYSYRWLLPWLLGPSPERWALLTYLSLLATPVCAWYYFAAQGFTGWRLFFATVLLSCLPGVRAASLRFPVLTDAPAFALSLLVTALYLDGHPWLAMLLSLPLGALRESAPIFAALWAGHPAPLVGLLAAGWTRPQASGREVPWLAHPWREAFKLRLACGADGSLYLRPWGGALFGLVPTWQTLLTFGIAHAQLFQAQDTIRLTVWAAPVLVANATNVIPPAFWPVAILVTALHVDPRGRV